MRDTFLKEIFSFFSEALPFWDKYLIADTEELALHWKKYNIPFPKTTFLTQLKNLQQNSGKLPDWVHANCILPPISIEQATDQIVASHRASFFEFQSMVDLTAGLGSDFYAHQANTSQAIALEMNDLLVDCLRFNLDRLQVRRQVKQSHAVDFMQQNQDFDFVFIDPARRDGQKSKIVQLSQMEPNILEIIPHLSKIDTTYIKLSPLFQWQEALSIPNLRRIWAISKKGECKEIGIELSNQTSENIKFRTVLAGKCSFDWTLADKNTEIRIMNNGKYLYEPDVSFYVLQAAPILLTHFPSINGMNHPFAYAFSDEFIEKFPGKCYEVMLSWEYNPKKIKQELQNLGISKIMISKKNYPDSVDIIRKQIGLKDGGELSLLVSMNSNQKRMAWLVKLKTD